MQIENCKMQKVKMAGIRKFSFFTLHFVFCIAHETHERAG